MWSLIFLEGEYLVRKIKGKKVRKNRKYAEKEKNGLSRRNSSKKTKEEKTWRSKALLAKKKIEENPLIFCSGLLLVGGGSPPEIWMPEAPPMQVHSTHRLTISINLYDFSSDIH